MQKLLFNFPKVGNTYALNEKLFKCIKVLSNNISKFQEVDKNNNPIIIRDKKNNRVIDTGIRIISNHRII